MNIDTHVCIDMYVDIWIYRHVCIDQWNYMRVVIGISGRERCRYCQCYFCNYPEDMSLDACHYIIIMNVYLCIYLHTYVCI